jgi:hypothetical protein
MLLCIRLRIKQVEILDEFGLHTICAQFCTYRKDTHTHTHTQTIHTYIYVPVCVYIDLYKEYVHFGYLRHS